MITPIKVDAKEIFDIAKKIEEAIQEHSALQVYMSCLFVASLAMNPEMTPDGVSKMIKETSKFMHMLDSGEDTSHMVIN